jgi:O-antigen/teichoic acid export membrane protein
MARAAISLIAGLLVARGLGPSDYGNLAYLLGSFWAIRALLDMGSGSAFYTFIAQRHRGRLFYLVYFCWLGFELVF